jgi:hypothetical protein
MKVERAIGASLEFGHGAQQSIEAVPMGDRGHGQDLEHRRRPRRRAAARFDCGNVDAVADLERARAVAEAKPPSLRRVLNDA